MFPKRNKLPIQKFPPKAETVFRGNFLSIKSSDNDFGYPRVGVVVPKKLVKSAVSRNSIKRLVFGFSKDTLDDLGSEKSIDLLVLIKKPIIRIDSTIKDGLEKEIEEGFKKI